MPQPQAASYRPPGAGTGPAAGPSNYATRPPPVPPQKDHMRAPPPIPPEEMHHVVQPLGQAPGAIYDSPQGSGLNHDEPDDGKLRQVLLPEEVIQKFMSIAKPNTLQNRETCGLLLGKRRTGGFAVTTLLIPRQRATSDTCEMVEEELILDFQETRGLITLGWIHTHPTQSCFMSSLDLHTHSGFQASLKEAFAIVCAPSQSPNVGIFRLTDPPGLQVISKCTIKESFHPHTAGNIYTDADQGHVKMMKKLDLSIVDLRRHSQ
ncbi:Mov34-domain-containing protein [Ceratobasidium sp. AG-I]|nr:Mov34-domain-containing protein [Ceratobasidium sp. AG-I]